MSEAWSYFWPAAATGLLIGGIAASAWLRRGRPLFVILGILLAAGAVALWHGPLGGSARLVADVERQARATLDAYEMTDVRAELHRGPVTRRLLLSGPADDFQRRELVRIMGELPGVSSVTWSPRSAGMPLLVESELVAGLGFLLGIMLAYLVDLRRRHNAEWKW